MEERPGYDKMPQPTSKLVIRLLGDFALVQDERPLPDLDAPRLQAFLTLLLLRHDAPQLRRHLAFQLWPNSAESQAQTNLRNLLHRLGQTCLAPGCQLTADKAGSGTPCAL